jgi:hypothetical protein
VVGDPPDTVGGTQLRLMLDVVCTELLMFGSALGAVDAARTSLRKLSPAELHVLTWN